MHRTRSITDNTQKEHDLVGHAQVLFNISTSPKNSTFP